MKLRFEKRTYNLKIPFRISRGEKLSAEALFVEMETHGVVGCAESIPYVHYGESVDGCLKELHSINSYDLYFGKNIQSFSCATRNALNCAIWDLRAKIADIPVWRLLDLDVPSRVRTAQTISMGDVEFVEKQANSLSDDALIKIKLGSKNDSEALRIIRKVRPESQIIVDANEGWDVYGYTSILPALIECNVAMIEQPFPSANDPWLDEIERPIPICADESVHHASDVERLSQRYDMVNIKLDKAGGLDEALLIKQEAQKFGMSYMVGCMVGSSLAMAPAFLLAQGADFVDLDGPLWLAEDCAHPIEFVEGVMYPPKRELWG